MRVVTLVGQMGAGKSTVARLLAARWAARGFRAVDLDDAIVARAGRSIPDIFASDGESVFRALERAALDDLLAQPGVILATGGGAPCQPGAMDAILAAGPAVWLDAAPEVLAARAVAGGGRPLLAGHDLAGATAFLATQRAEREPDYLRATCIVDATASADAVAATIAALLPPELPWP